MRQNRCQKKFVLRLSPRWRAVREISPNVLLLSRRFVVHPTRRRLEHNIQVKGIIRRKAGT